VSNVTQMPEAGYRLAEIRERPCSVSYMPWWRFVFKAQAPISEISIWTDEVHELEIIAPGQMTVDEAREWAKQRVPKSYLLLHCYREFGDQV